MGTTSSLRIVVGIAALAAISVAGVAQTQNQNPPSQNQTQTQQNQSSTQSQTQPQQAQPQQKQSFWQKMKQSALQDMQNTTQQGTQQAQQGVTNGVGQGMQTLQQGAGGNSGNAAFGGSNSSSSCGPTCFNAGPFLANVAQMTMSQEGPWHVIRMNIQFQNMTNQPLVIAYHDGSMIMTDNNGNTYQGAGGNPGELQGMGIDRGAQTDPQFVLNPGQTSSAMFCVARGRPANSPIGTAYTYNLTIDELQTQNGATAIAVRSYNLNFPTLTPGSASSFASLPSSSAGNVLTGGSGANTTATSATVPATQAARTATASPSTGVTNAAMKSTVGATAKPSAVVKPVPTTTTPTNVKKPTATNNNQPKTNTPSDH